MAIVWTSTTFRAFGHAESYDDALSEATELAAKRGVKEPRVSIGGDNKRRPIPEGSIPWELTGRSGR